MHGIITSYKRSIKRTSTKHIIAIIDGVKSREEAKKLVGKKATWNTGTKDMNGKVASAHGNKGAIRIIFESGMPGQAVGGKIVVA